MERPIMDCVEKLLELSTLIDITSTKTKRIGLIYSDDCGARMVLRDTLSGQDFIVRVSMPQKEVIVPKKKKTKAFPKGKDVFEEAVRLLKENDYE